MKQQKRINKIKTDHGVIKLPAFMPDATYGAIKSISFNDAKNSDVKEIVTTTLHIETTIGSDYIQEYGGIHKFFNWNRPILTDSGGFQVYSLIHAKKIKENKITDEGAFFKNPIDGTVHKLTPESSQQIQHKLGSDIRIVLDEPINNDASEYFIKKAVDRTTAWAKRSKDEFLKIYGLTEKEFNDPENFTRPKLMAVVQGANILKERERSFNELHEIGFDGYNWGGWPFKDNGELDDEVGKFLPSIIPNDKVAYAMGVGTPDDIIRSYEWGWNLFDCVLPTRNARHGFLFTRIGVGDKAFKNYSVMHIKREQYKFDTKPVDLNCKCECCQSAVTRAYLRHLIRIKEPVGFRLATIHNLQFYSDLMSELREK